MGGGVRFRHPEFISGSIGSEILMLKQIQHDDLEEIDNLNLFQGPCVLNLVGMLKQVQHDVGVNRHPEFFWSLGN